MGDPSRDTRAFDDSRSRGVNGDPQRRFSYGNPPEVYSMRAQIDEFHWLSGLLFNFVSARLPLAMATSGTFSSV